MCSGDFAALEASAISREPERLRDAQDTINGITDIVNRADLADRAPASSTCKRRADQQLRLAVSALASLIPVDRRLDGGFRLKTGRGVFGLGVVIAPTAQFVGI